MHAWLCETTDGPEALAWKETPTPEPGEGEVRIAVKAASLNFPDILITQGKYQFKPPLPFVPGAEYAGIVDKVGPGVSHLTPGMPVAAIAGTGGFGTYACVKAAQVLPLPPGFKLEDAAAFAFTYGTSHHALIDRGALQPGETVLVLGAAGGVGTAAIQIAKAAGARVIAAASTDEKCETCRALGADATINYSREKLREALAALTGGKGPDLVYDPIGGDLAEQAFRSIAWRGRYLVIGFAAGGIPALPFNLPLLKGASVVGVFWGDFVKREPGNSARALAQLSQWYAEGKVKPVIDELLPISELPHAYRRMASREVRGKLVMQLD
ncbi:MAG TPA: NADPH:quinone oxidoreductase family protein [Ideonella sp.]|uniref:NADPH:quinone oxidoreductase family protein n=1 Tax=Ideonella sp. TaxID=1929293 RepID=UPI002BE15096|nr:NADPH:quinone oxidoreductase family protein [Ideonella sp.]HSI46881.1 NADPH:quinone oxidoreductase family protein [Ideonella sp.]